MAFAATASTKESRSFSIGPYKVQLFTWSAASADVSGTVTATQLTSVDHIIMDGGLVHTAAPSVSGNVVTLAFNDPAATVYGTLMVFGR